MNTVQAFYPTAMFKTDFLVISGICLACHDFQTPRRLVEAALRNTSDVINDIKKETHFLSRITNLVILHCLKFQAYITFYFFIILSIFFIFSISNFYSNKYRYMENQNSCKETVSL